MSAPTISVVTPSYNQACYLETTIQSVLSQDYPNIEYIIIDGGSTDGSVEIIKKYADRLSYWCSEQDEGQADAIGKGFDRATGDILCWLNSDDVYLPGALKTVANYFEKHPDAIGVSGGAYLIDAEGNFFNKYSWSVTLGVRASFDRLRYRGMDGMMQQSTFWRKEAYSAVGGVDRSLECIMDLDLFTKLARLRRFHRIPKMLASFRIHDESKTSAVLRNCSPIWWKEQAEFRARFGVDERKFGDRIAHWRYRLPNIVRKILLRLAVQAGVLRLPN